MTKKRIKGALPGQVGGPCPRCLPLAFGGAIRVETVMPLPPPGAAPLARDGSGPCCYDCAAADGVDALLNLGRSVWGRADDSASKRPLRTGMPFAALRIVVGNERQESLRLPEDLRKHFGLVAQGIVRASVGANALDDHHAWLASVGINLDGLGSDSED